MSLTLGIDVGTSATKVLLLDRSGKWEMDTWPSSQGVWPNLKLWLAQPSELGERGERVSRVGITAHGPSAIVIRNGGLVGRQIHWHEPLPEGCERPIENDHRLPPTRAWVPARLAQWELENGPIGDGIAIQLKDFLNWEITDIIARDTRSMRGYSGEGNLHLPEQVIGIVTTQGSSLSGIAQGAEVICGCDDLSAGILGLGLGKGELFNLANTSEHVGMVGGLPERQMCWLPALGRLPALSYLATSTGGKTLMDFSDEPPSLKAMKRYISQLEDEEKRGLGFKSDSINDADWAELGEAWRVLLEVNRPIEEIRQRFPQGELHIGGGLALIPQLVKSRGATIRAGQEVSVLGVAKLAQPPLAVIFGAGKVGRGFLAQLLVRAGWRIHFVDSNPSLISELAGGSYHIINLGTEEREEISGYTASGEDYRLDEASLILTSLGASHLGNWAKSIAGLDRSVDIILAENHPAPAKLVRSHLKSNRVGVAQAQVLRSCIEPTTEQVAELGSLTIQVQDHWSLPLDADALVRKGLLNSVAGFEPRPNFDLELTRKLYTYNAVNAVVSYLGHLSGYELLAEAATDPAIAEMGMAAGAEASAALVDAHGFDEREQAEWVERALAKYQDHRIKDPIARQCRDPMRKLGKHDRLLGPILLAISNGLACESLAVAVAAALRYSPNNEEEANADPSLATLRELKRKGMGEIVGELFGTPNPRLVEILNLGEKNLDIWLQKNLG